MDPVQLQLMQQIAMGQVPGIPGTQAPLTIGGFGGAGSGGASIFTATTTPGMSPYVRAIAGDPLPDISPLAPLQPVLSRFGIVGTVAGLAGNAALTNMLDKAGVMPTGNAGSYLQAYRTREFQQMQREVAAQVADADAEGIYRTFRGGAALIGMPFNRKQQEAARNLANTIAEYGPTLALAAPELLDVLAGERGSVQAMAGQMMEANRYRIDPLTGQMGYGAESNAELVDRTFNQMFEGDNVARMQGLRAGDMGQLYRILAPEGAVGPRESLRDRTLTQLIRARDANQLEAIGAEAEVDVSGNLAELSNEDLLKLRSTSSMRSRMTDADARQISDQLKDYVSTLAAIREVFGENGNPNAPIPQLINALETLTSGQMHRFDSVRLNTLIRDMQSLVQLSGKSIDQYMAMRRHAADEGQQLGIGTTFATTATNVGITTGMAFAERGGATGFGALSREEAEQASMNLFNRGMASEMSNALGALGRIEAVSGFATGDDAAGRAGGKLRAIMEAARAGENTYIDPTTGDEMYLPTREAHFRSLITAGGVIGMNGADFNMMLGDRTSNLRMLHSDPRLQQAAFNNQAREINVRVDRQIGNRLSSAEPLMTAGLDAGSRNAAARAMGSAALTALNDLSPAEAENKTTRNRAIADALLTEAGNQGIELSEQEARVMAVSVYGQAENGVRSFGFDNWTAFAQVLGEDVTESRKEQTAQYRARAGVNEAMSGLGPQGTIMQRFFTALQQQGDRGGAANLNTMLQDMFGADIDKAREKLMPELQAVADEKLAIDTLRGELEGASPADRRELERKIEARTSELKARVAETQAVGRELGIGGGTEIFDLEDVNTARKAARNLSNFNRIDQVRLLAATGNVTEADVMQLAQEQLTSQDFRALGAEDRRLALAAAVQAAEGDIEALPEEVRKRYDDVLATAGEAAARKRIKQQLLDDVDTVEEFASKRSKDYQGLVIADIDNEAERATIVRQRRMSRILVPTEAEITTRLEELNESRDRPAVSSLLTRSERAALQQEIKQLEAQLEGPTSEQQESIKQQIESRKAELNLAVTAKQQTLQQEIEQLNAELEGPTSEQQEDLRQQIESRELALVAADPVQRQILQQEIQQLEAQLPDSTPEQQESIKQQIESRKMALVAADPARQQTLVQEIEQLKTELEGPTSKQQESIKQQIESRELALVAADPVQRQVLVQEIQQLKAELSGPTPEQQKDLRQQIESRELALSRESVPAQQQLLVQEIRQLESQLSGPTPEQQKDLRQQIESRELALTIADPARQQTLVQEIEQLKTELEGPTSEQQESIKQQIESRELALVAADPARQQMLQQEIQQLKAELSGPTPEQQEDVRKQIETRKQEAAELRPLTSEQQESIENAVAQEFGFESYAAYSQRLAEEITPERRAELQKQITVKQAQLAKPIREVREAEDYAQTLMVEELILAEKQLQAVGLLTEEQTLEGSKDGTLDTEDFDVMERQAPELQAKLAKSKIEDRAGIVSKYFDQRVRQQFYSTAIDAEAQAVEIEQNRVAAREALSKPEGRRALSETRANLATLADMRREFLMDEGAAVRLGSAVTLDAITRSREADLNLQNLSNDYYGGSSELLLTTLGVGMTAEGAERAANEFQELTANPRTEANAKKLGDIAARLSTEYETDISTSDLSLSHYKEYIALRGTDYVTEMTKANETLAAGVTSRARAESMGVTEEQLESLQELTKLEAADFSKAAKALGMTEEEYKAVMTGKEELQPGLRLFKGEDAAKQLRAARADDAKLSEIDTSIEKLKRDIDTSVKHSPDGKASPSLLKGLEKMQASRATIAERQTQVMQTARLDSSKPADRQKFQQLLTAQGEVQLLETRTENYVAARQELINSGQSAEDIDIRLGEMKAAEIKAQADLKAFRDLDLGDAGEAIARGFAIDAQSDPEKAKELRSAIESGGTSEAHERNLKLVSGVLSRVKDFEIGEEGATSIKKLDELTDQYLAAKKSGGNALQELANTHGMQVSELDSMMDHTEFLGMALGEEEDEYSPERLGKAFRAAMNTDIAAEVAAEEERQLEITGTVVVTGVVTGEGTFEDSVGRTVR